MPSVKRLSYLRQQLVALTLWLRKKNDFLDLPSIAALIGDTEKLFENLNWLQLEADHFFYLKGVNQAIEFRTTEHKCIGTLIAELYILAV